MKKSKFCRIDSKSLFAFLWFLLTSGEKINPFLCFHENRKKYESFFMVTKMILRSEVGANSRGDLSIKDLSNQPFVHNSKIDFVWFGRLLIRIWLKPRCFVLIYSKACESKHLHLIKLSQNGDDYDVIFTVLLGFKPTTLTKKFVCLLSIFCISHDTSNWGKQKNEQIIKTMLFPFSLFLYLVTTYL